ncbi:MAG: hypothetical protein ACXVFM_23470 [Solirubrobacteraceae bacterium]
MDSERIIRDLAAALPEAFEGHDLVEDYYSDWGESDQRWLAYMAVADARMWIEEHALSIDVLRRVARVRPGCEDALRRYLDYFESLAPDRDRSVQNLLEIELFEGVVWVQDVIDYVGPHTRAVMRRAQDHLAWCNSAIGRWPD